MNSLHITIAVVLPLHVISQVAFYKDPDCTGPGFVYSSSAAELPTDLKNSLSSFLMAENAVLGFYQFESFNGKHSGESYVYNCRTSNATKCTNLGILERKVLSIRIIQHTLLDELMMFTKENFGGTSEKVGANSGKISAVKNQIVSLVIFGASAWTLCEHAKCSNSGRVYCIFPSSGKYYWPTVFTNLFKEIPYDFRVQAVVLGCYWHELKKSPSNFWESSFY
ncbi:unnamed protein product [Allacma fusca]|uniref:Uncharacterized protein n=1 Tax=Allacma fusca TaxID=39272 RepID=A0A8J2PR92_9HEXA|nr:unnamed protein product [Allacma fusca]